MRWSVIGTPIAFILLLLQTGDTAAQPDYYELTPGPSYVQDFEGNELYLRHSISYDHYSWGNYTHEQSVYMNVVYGSTVDCGGVRVHSYPQETHWEHSDTGVSFPRGYGNTPYWWTTAWNTSHENISGSGYIGGAQYASDFTFCSPDHALAFSRHARWLSPFDHAQNEWGTPHLVSGN